MQLLSKYCQWQALRLQFSIKALSLWWLHLKTVLYRAQSCRCILHFRLVKNSKKSLLTRPFANWRRRQKLPSMLWKIQSSGPWYNQKEIFFYYLIIWWQITFITRWIWTQTNSEQSYSNTVCRMKTKETNSIKYSRTFVRAYSIYRKAIRLLNTELI